MAQLLFLNGTMVNRMEKAGFSLRMVTSTRVTLRQMKRMELGYIGRHKVVNTMETGIMTSLEDKQM